MILWGVFPFLAVDLVLKVVFWKLRPLLSKLPDEVRNTLRLHY
jgi:hypothetical protein